MPTSTSDAIAQWLSSWDFHLIKDITDTTRDGVAQAVAKYLSGEGMTIGDLENELAQYFGPDRALRIAVTETTRAYAEGDRIATQSLRDAGLPVKDIWNTKNDGFVDDDCKLRNGKTSDQWATQDYPPLHPNCRCWITHRVF